MTEATINRRGAKDAETILNARTEEIIGAAIDVHLAIGPGLLESAYEECLCHELTLRNVPFRRQHPLPVHYKCVKRPCPPVWHQAHRERFSGILRVLCASAVKANGCFR